MSIQHGTISGIFLLATILLNGCSGETEQKGLGGGGGGNGGGGNGGGGGDGSYGNPYIDADFDGLMGTNQVYMSPTGVITGDCSTQQTACRTFAYAISQMVSGDGLILMDGDYDSIVNGELRTTDNNGNSLPNGAASAQLPAGVSAAQPTIARALNPGNVFIEGGFTLGTKFAKVQYIIVYGLTFFQPSSIRNADYSVLKATGVYGGLSVGTSDHIMGTRFNLIEDVWIWGKNVRGNLTNFVGNNNLYRRVLMRDDGCDALNCGEGAGNLKISNTIYSSNNVTFENIISIDKILRANTYGTGSYADFATAQHGDKAFGTPGGELQGFNQWLGCMAINSEDAAINFEADNVMDAPVTTITIRDFVALNTRAGVSMDGARRAYTGVSKQDVSGIHIRTRDTPDFNQGCTVLQTSGDPGCSVHVPNDPVGAGVVTLAAYAAGQSSLLPLVRYGTTVALWPWPYEARIHSDICNRINFNPNYATDGTGAGPGVGAFPQAGIRNTKNFCSYNGSLSNYINSF